MGHTSEVNDPTLVDGFYNWGTRVNSREREFELSNGKNISVSVVNSNGSSLKQYANQSSHIGYGIGDSDGGGMNQNERLIIDFTENPLTYVQFGLDGLGGLFVDGSSTRVEITFALEDGSEVVKSYQKSPGDTGNSQLLYEFDFSSPNNPIVSMELESTGGSWELRYISGYENPTSPDSFNYLAVDSDMEVSETKTVTLTLENAPEYTAVDADSNGVFQAGLGQEVMLGTDGQDIFKWLDDALDSGKDVVVNFNIEDGDVIDLSDVLDVDEEAGVDDDVDETIDDLINAEVVGNDVVLTVDGGDTEQKIVIHQGKEILEDYISANDSIDELGMYAEILKLTD
ncbi:type I secretion C-terminal target domain-containing protein [Vibrio sp. OCN044]|uniref:Type I secretion C-terminal target domain-containing protein n=2 Tax=Vibrio tetraodonis TaxID=2231647 RepID=A0A6L8LZB8_9VIBR|nr:type I secretion C-terminal target domain-containing protein [Vibrio tetraodonis subsp. pristinus]